MAKKDKKSNRLIKVVYFDEQSASDYLDIMAGGKEVTSSENVKERANEQHSRVESKLIARLSWLPFLGASGEAGGGVEFSRAGQSILSKTLSNTILTDYLDSVHDNGRVKQMQGLKVAAREGSMAHIKMYTPFMVAAQTRDQDFDLAKLDEALERAKGYYELVATDQQGKKSVLRFNIGAFRNNYGLTDLNRMQLVFHGVRVGQTTEAQLDMQAEMSSAAAFSSDSLTGQDVVDGVKGEGPELLEMFDVILAGVEDVE